MFYLFVSFLEYCEGIIRELFLSSGPRNYVFHFLTVILAVTGGCELNLELIWKRPPLFTFMEVAY